LNGTYFSPALGIIGFWNMANSSRRARIHDSLRMESNGLNEETWRRLVKKGRRRTTR
jgi:hypothetical protein